MFNLQHDLDALLIAVVGLISLLWLGRNIFLAMRDVVRESRAGRRLSHS